MMVNFHSDIRIKIIYALDDFVKLENIWDKLLESAHFESIFFTYQWFSCFINSFGLANKLFIIVIYKKNDPVGILPLYRDKYESFGIKFNILRSITNAHTPKFSFIIRSGYENLVEKILVQSIEMYPWDLIQIDYVIEESYLLNKSHPCSWKPFSFKMIETLKSPHLMINCDWSDYWHNRITRSLRKNIMRQERQARDKFGIAFERISGELLHSGDLEDAFIIEDSGWKGEKRTSILKNPDFENFYRKLAFEMNSKGCFELYFLRLGDKRVAFEYCLNNNSTIYSLKVGYVEEYKRYGPGFILQKMVLHHAFMNQYQKYDMLGAMDPYKLKWTNGADALYSIYVFNRKFKSYILKFFMFIAPEFINRLGMKNILKDYYTKIKDLSRRKLI